MVHHTTKQNDLTSIREGSFDTSLLEKELVDALEQDRKYKLTDEMKKRAIKTASSYDEFKNYVACADLIPLSQREMQDLNARNRDKVRASKLQTNRFNVLTEAPEAVKTFKPNQPTTRPKTALELIRNWHRHCVTNDDKYLYLVFCGPKRLKKIFKAEMDPDFMVALIQCLLEKAQCESDAHDDDDDWHLSVQLLEMMSEIKRFALQLSFFTAPQQHQVESLMHALAECAQRHDDTPEQEWAQKLTKLHTKFQLKHK